MKYTVELLIDNQNIEKLTVSADDLVKVDDHTLIGSGFFIQMNPRGDVRIGDIYDERMNVDDQERNQP